MELRLTVSRARTPTASKCTALLKLTFRAMHIYGVSKVPAPVIAGVGDSSPPIFEPLEPRLPPIVEEPPRSAGWSLDTVVNLVSLLLILSLGCSMLVPLGEPHSEDDDAFLRVFKTGKQKEISGFGTTGSHHCL
jgi:hypothetical protein